MIKKRDDMFNLAINVVDQANIMPRNEIALIQELSSRVKAAANAEAKEEQVNSNFKYFIILTF